MEGSDIQLSISGPPKRATLGRLAVKTLQNKQDAPKGLRLFLEYHPNLECDLHPIEPWVWLEATISGRDDQHEYVYGAVDVAANGLFNPGYESQNVLWTWELTSQDLEAIERHRHAQSRMLYFTVKLAGIIHAADEIRRVSGDGSFTIPLSQWEDCLSALGYQLPPSTMGLAGLASTTHPSWDDAMRQLEEARKHIRAGEDYQALTAALDKFSAVVKAPYNPDSWLELLKDDEPAQRREAISQELGRHCTLLNRVGWHRGATESDEGQHHRMPLDHWEAELLVATSQFLLTYAIRLKMISPNAHQG